MLPQDSGPTPLGPDLAGLYDAALVALARAGRPDAFRQIMQRCNRRLFRVARGIMHDDAEAEDVVQAAFEHLEGFRVVDNDHIDAMQSQGDRVIAFPNKFGSEDPAAAAARGEIRRMLERAVDDLPEAFRIVFVMREIEACSVDDTATSLGLRPETVKTRLHRARRLLRTALSDQLASTMTDAFPVLGARCERMTGAVLARLPIDPSLQPPTGNCTC